MQILPVEVVDKAAIIALFALDKKIWPSGVGMSWYWFWNSPAKREYWVKAVEGDKILGSVHWSVRRDDVRNLRDIIVSPTVRGKGIGKLLVEHVGSPVILKTDHDSEANRFYQHLGFVQGETRPSKNGKKLLTGYSR